MNLKPYFTLLLSQTLFVHGEQATDFANNFLVGSSAFPAEMTLVLLGIDLNYLFEQSLCSSNSPAR